MFGVGKNLDVSPYPNGLVGSNYYINVMMPKNPDISFLGSDLFNFDLANELDEYIEIKIKPTDSLSWSVANNKSGLTLAMFYIYSFSREANERRAKGDSKVISFERINVTILKIFLVLYYIYMWVIYIMYHTGSVRYIIRLRISHTKSVRVLQYERMIFCTFVHIFLFIYIYF